MTMITIFFATKLCKKSCSKFYVIRVVYAYIYIYFRPAVRRARAVNAQRANVGPAAPVEVQWSI